MAITCMCVTNTLMLTHFTFMPVKTEFIFFSPIIINTANVRFFLFPFHFSKSKFVLSTKKLDILTI